MVRNWRTIAVLAALAAYAISFWVWKSYGFPIDVREIPKALSDSTTFIFGFITVLSTVVVACFTVVLARVGRRQIQDTRILQRAYIAVEPHGIHEMLEGDRVIGHIKIVNAGNLPARNLGWFIGVKFSGDGAEQKFPLGNRKGNIVIAPRAYSVRGSGSYVSPEALRKAAGGWNADPTTEIVQHLYVWGVIQYSDGFNNIRITEFCHRYNWKMRGRGDVGPYEISPEYARHHEYGNDAT
jgi:hypothetical protein